MSAVGRYLLLVVGFVMCVLIGGFLLVAVPAYAVLDRIVRVTRR